MKIVKAEKVSKKYGTNDNPFYALREINFSVERGETVAIIGKSGSGKSTLLHILSGVDDYSDGEVFLMGKSLSNISNKQKTQMRINNIGFVFQFFNLVPNFNALDNVLLPAVLGGVDIDRKYVEELFEKVGLTHKVRALPSQLSGGEQQRIAMIRALVNKPKIIFADEPCGNLDSGNGKIINDLLFSTAKANSTTLVYVTHDNEQAMLADRIVTISDGKLVGEVNRR